MLEKIIKGVQPKPRPQRSAPAEEDEAERRRRLKEETDLRHAQHGERPQLPRF